MIACRSCGKSGPAALCRSCRRSRYGRQHRHLRSRWSTFVAAGGVECVRCGLDIEPGEEWELDHAPKGYAPAHKFCNRSAGGRSV